jgi:hypothetical protein
MQKDTDMGVYESRHDIFSTKINPTLWQISRRGVSSSLRDTSFVVEPMSESTEIETFSRDFFCLGSKRFDVWIVIWRISWNSALDTGARWEVSVTEYSESV